MKIIKSSTYEAQAAKLIKQHKVSAQDITDTEEAFRLDPKDKDLRPHKITCKKDKRRRSITVLNTNLGYRILYTADGDNAVFQQILHHDRYDRVNKDC